MHSFSVTLLGLCIYSHLGPSNLGVDNLYFANRNIFLIHTAESRHWDLISRCSFESIDRTWARSYLPWRVWTLGDNKVSLHRLPLSHTPQNSTTYQYSYKEVRVRCMPFIALNRSPCALICRFISRVLGVANKVFRGTILAQWHYEERWNRHNKTRSIALAHAMRFALLYKYGGIVTDFDMLWFKRVDMTRFGRNFVGIESASQAGIETKLHF